MENKPFNRVEIITEKEIEKLIDALLIDAEFHPYAIYGLMFLFGSIKKLRESGNEISLEQIYTPALVKLYSLSENVYEAIDRTTKNIHIHYRAADFTRDNQQEICLPFIMSECGEIQNTEANTDEK